MNQRLHGWGGIRAVALGAVMAVTATFGPAAPLTAQSPSGGYTPPPSDITATLTIANWGDPQDQATYKGVAERFKAKYPNVTVVDNFTPITTWSEYINKIVAQVAAGQAPDIISTGVEGVRLGIANNLFRPLDDYVANDPAITPIVADIDSRLFDGLSQDGQLYLFPGPWNGMLIYYNTKMFKDAGIDPPSNDWTWDDFLEIAKKLTTGEGDNKVFGFVLPWFNFGLSPWFFTNGTQPLNDDWTASNLTDPKMAEAAAWVRDLVTVHGVAPQPKGADPYQLFPAGKAAMTGAGHWVVGPFKNAGFTDFDVVQWPQNKAKSTTYGPSGYGIYPGSQNADLAWEYIKELESDATMQAWVAQGAANPARKSFAESPDFLSFPPNAKEYYGLIDYGKVVNAPTVFNVLEPATMRAMDSIMAGEDPAAALAKADKEVSDAFAAEE